MSRLPTSALERDGNQSLLSPPGTRQETWVTEPLSEPRHRPHRQSEVRPHDPEGRVRGDVWGNPETGPETSGSVVAPSGRTKEKFLILCIYPETFTEEFKPPQFKNLMT